MIQYRSFSSVSCTTGGHDEQFHHEQKCPVFDVVCPAFPLPTTAPPTLQGALMDAFGKDVMCVTSPRHESSPSFDSCRERFLWAHKEADLAQHPVVDPMFQIGDVEKLLQAFGLDNLDFFS